MALLITWIEL